MRELLGLQGRVEARRWTRNRAGIYVPDLYYRTRNTIVDAGRVTIAQRVRFLDGSVRTIRGMGVGTGRTVPTGSDTALENSLATDDIDSFDDANLSGSTPYWKAIKQWQPDEANSSSPGITEVVLLFDDDSLFARALWGQGTITGATQADPVEITSAGHGLSTGDQVYIENVGGMTEINDRVFTITVTGTNTFTLDDEDGQGHTAFSPQSPETAQWTKTVTKTSAQIVETRYRITFG